MIFYTIIIISVAYRLVKYIDYLSEINDPVKYRKSNKVEYDISHDKLKFLVNGEEVDKPLHEYYLKILGLYSTRPINSETIRLAYRHKAFVINHSEGNELLPDIQDINAARGYLLDQWEYITRFN